RLQHDTATRKRERMQLEDELVKVDSVHKAKIQLDQLNERKKAISLEQQQLQAERLSLMRDAWRDLLRPKLSLRRDHLLHEMEQVTAAMSRRAGLESQAANI